MTEQLTLSVFLDVQASHFVHIRHLKKRKDEPNHFTGFDTLLDGRGHI